MMKHARDSQAGTTLVEVFVALMILLLSVALILPALQPACRRATTANCMAKTKAIAGSLRTYASSWDGWTNPDPGCYVKLMGYKLNSEEGYFGENPPWYDPSSPSPSQSQRHAAGIEAFCCHVDKSPALNVHGHPSSYQVTALFAGGNLVDIKDPSRTIAVAEVGQRHPAGMDQEGRRVLDGHWVYADLHSSLGYSGQLWRTGLPTATKD